jgi:hypothetical protein
MCSQPGPFVRDNEPLSFRTDGGAHLARGELCDRGRGHAELRHRSGGGAPGRHGHRRAGGARPGDRVAPGRDGGLGPGRVLRADHRSWREQQGGGQAGRRPWPASAAQSRGRGRGARLRCRRTRHARRPAQPARGRRLKRRSGLAQRRRNRAQRGPDTGIPRAWRHRDRRPDRSGGDRAPASRTSTGCEPCRKSTARPRRRSATSSRCCRWS